MEQSKVKSRIRQTAQSTDALIARLDTLTNRIDTAKANQNSELVEYYENQFIEVSTEFMVGVESILDDWYALKGEDRPPADREAITPELLEEIHGTVVEIVQGLSVDLSQNDAPETGPAASQETLTGDAKPRTKRSGNQVDLTG